MKDSFAHPTDNRFVVIYFPFSKKAKSVFEAQYCKNVANIIPDCPPSPINLKFSGVTLDITSHHEDVCNGIQNDKDCFGIFRGKQIQEWFQDIGLNKMNHLLNGAPTGKVGNSPHSLFLCFIITLQENKWSDELYDDTQLLSSWVKYILSQASQSNMEQGQHWWPPGSECPSLQWYLKESMLLPSEHWIFCGTAVGGTWQGCLNPERPASVHLYQSQCYRWLAVKVSTSRKTCQFKSLKSVFVPA